jgi:hypothetical protein
MRRRSQYFALCGVICLLAAVMLESSTKPHREAISLAPALPSKQKPGASSGPNLYEDGDVTVSIPSGWSIARTSRRVDDSAQPHPPAVPETFVPGSGDGVLLTTQGYTLSLAYRASHASGIAGGRFIEVFRIPWLADVSDSWACSGYLRHISKGIHRGLTFFSLTFDNPGVEGRQACDIPNAVVGHKWFAGYFSTAKGHWYFDSEGDGCPQKAYTLTSSSKTPTELPDIIDPMLKRVINEASEIVASIQYKRCLPERPWAVN